VQDIADEVVVSAPVDRVWKAIADPGEHVAWHPFATRIDGEHALGEVRRCASDRWPELAQAARACPPAGGEQDSAPALCLRHRYALTPLRRCLAVRHACGSRAGGCAC